MACTDPNVLYRRKSDHSVISFNEPKRSEAFLYEKFETPCRQCLDCRIAYGGEWSTRIMHEAQVHKRNCVVTLTYDDAHLPHRVSLQYLDVQAFWKRLRKHLAKIGWQDALVYVVVGEYGDLNHRPHYHACLMGVDFDDKEFFKKAADGSKLYTSKTLSDLWPLGDVMIGDLTKESADYVGRYQVKKVNGERAKLHYARVDVETGECYWLTPEFLRVSKGRAKPGEVLPFGRGVGARFLEKFWSDVFPGDHIVFKGGREGRVPRYYDRLLRRRDRPLFDELKAKREAEAQTPERLAEQTPQRRSVRDQISKARLAQKRRQL